MSDWDGLRGCAQCGNDTTGRLCTSCAQQEMIDNYDGDYGTVEIDHRAELEDLRKEYQSHLAAEPRREQAEWQHWHIERRAMQERSAYLCHWIRVLHGENPKPVG